jgi:Fe-S-cluster-containing hydrogenase component 2
MDARVVTREALQPFLESLTRHGYQIVGPRIRDGAIGLGLITTDRDLPVGWTDEQGPARYRLRERGDAAVFGYTVGPHSWKRWLSPPAATIWRVRRDDGGFAIEPPREPPPRQAFLGVRACELHALAILDRILLEGSYFDPGYRARRGAVLIVAVNCARAGGTCFCASMGTGPRATGGFDLVLTELLDHGRHEFFVEIGTQRGADVLDGVPSRDATPEDRAQADRESAAAAGHMGRDLPTDGLRDALVRNLDHPRWDEVAARCLSCTNCTMVCPTCFCSTTEDATDLSGLQAERRKRWDSCFNREFSYIAGGVLRASPRARYRQWLTHKLAHWVDQFGTFGCVGCGRCITWCPAGIDITEEARAIRETEHAHRPPAVEGGPVRGESARDTPGGTSGTLLDELGGTNEDD